MGLLSVGTVRFRGPSRGAKWSRVKKRSRYGVVVVAISGGACSCKQKIYKKNRKK